MSDHEDSPPEAPEPPKSASDRQPQPHHANTAACSSEDGSASINSDDLSDSGSEDYCDNARRGGSARRVGNRSPMRKRRKRPEWSRNEEETLAQVHCSVGNQWSVIAARLPGRTANEVKNIWHSTLRSKHLKARSLLRAYATALNGRWDDAAARQEAYTAALSQHGSSGNAALPSPLPLELGGLAPGNDDQYAAETPRLAAAAGLPELKATEAQTPDSSRSPAALLARQRAGRGPPATAPRPLADDRTAARGGHQRQQQSRAARRPASPSSCPARGPQARGDVVETRGPIAAQARPNAGNMLALPFAGLVPGGDAAASNSATETGVAATTPLNDYAQLPSAATTAARPLPLTFGGAWGPPPQLPQRLWPPQLPMQTSGVRDPQQMQQQTQQQEQEDQQQREEQSAPVHHTEGQLLHVVATKAEPKEGIQGAAQTPQLLTGHDRVLGMDAMDAWLGRLDPSMMLTEDEVALREQVRRGVADPSSISSVPRAVSVSAVAATVAPGDVSDGQQVGGPTSELVESGRSRSLTWPRPGQRSLGPPNAAAHHGRAGPASGAWSSNSVAGGPQLQSPPPDSGGAGLHLHVPQAAAPDLSAAMAVSPTARVGSGGGSMLSQQDTFGTRLTGHWAPGTAAAAVHGAQDRLPYGALGALGMYAGPPGASASAEGHMRPIAPPGWSLAAPGAAGIPHGGWRDQLSSPHQHAIRPGAGGSAHTADLRGGMYMVPVQASPLQALPPPSHMVFGAPPPQMLHAYQGQLPYHDLFGRRQRQREHLMYQQQQQQLVNQHQQQLVNQQQYQQQEQQQQYEQQAGQRQQKQQCQYQQQEQLKQEPQEEQQQQQLSQFQQQQPPEAQQPSAPSSLQQEQLALQQQLQQHLQQQQQQAQQALEQHTDSLSSSDVVTMGLDSLQDPQLRWCLMDMD